MPSAPVFLGFRVKQPWKPDPQWWPEGAGRVERVCSVSDCLIDNLEDALRPAQLFNAEQPEPGDYVVVKVATKARR